MKAPIRHFGEHEPQFSGDALHTTAIEHHRRANTIVVGATIATTPAEQLAEHIVLISVDGTPGDALQVHGTYEQSLLASVDRRRLTPDLGVLILHRMYGEDVEISVGHMPSAVTR